MLAAPVLVDGTVYAVDARGSIHAIDEATGARRWRHDDLDDEWNYLDPVITGPLAVWDSLLFFPDAEFEDCILVHERSTGQLLRRLEGGGSCTVVDDLLLVFNNGIRAFDLPDFTPRWHNDSWPGLMESPPAITESGVAFAALGLEAHHSHSGVVAFDVASGRSLFMVGDDQGADCPIGALKPPRADTGKRAASDWVMFAQTHPVVTDGLVWMPVRRVHSDDGAHIHPRPWTSAEVVGLDPATGDRRWLYRFPPERESEVTGALAVADGLIYATVFDAEVPGGDPEPPADVMLSAIDIAAARAAWTIRLPEAPVGSPVLADGLLYLAFRKGTVGAYAASTGEPVWSLGIDDDIVGGRYDLDDNGAYYEEEAPAILPGDGAIYVRTRTGVTALR